MAKAKAPSQAIRAPLMRTTALQAVALAALGGPAFAQISATTRPTNGQVTAGQASIGGNAATTLITQKSQNAVITWKTYDIGSGQTVQYAQPNAAAITLNTVIAPNPSQIFGKILANGQIIIVNQSGVVFARGSQVDTAGLIVSSAGISQKDFMAGRLIFSQPGQAGAAISNAGNITVRQAGLAALVAPQVANSGTISATLGRVILAGATTHTLDLYGDGLVALNITGQVTQVSLGGRLVPALVTNTGTILAPGGTVVLTASAADNVVTNLVSAGGTIAAPTLGNQTGRVLVQGIGGGISIDGAVSATGTAAGSLGGQVVADATGAVNVAQGALLDASGQAGGGIVAVGTTAARAAGGASVRPTLVAQSVTLAAGARLQANATGAGQGGRIAVQAAGSTSQQAAISATGGPQGGAGGWIEVSGHDLQLGGGLDTSAQAGKPGTIFLDPYNIDIGTIANVPDGTLDITPAEFARFANNIILQASGTISVVSAVATGARATSLQLEGDGGIIIAAPLDAAGIPVGLKSTGGSITETLTGSIAAASIAAFAGGAIDLPRQDVSTTIGTFNNTSITSTALLSGGVVGTDPESEGLVLLPPALSNEIDLAGLVAPYGDVTVSVSGTNTAGTAPNILTINGPITAETIVLGTTGSVAGTTADAIDQISGEIEATGRTIIAQPQVIYVPGTVRITAASGDISLAGSILTATPTIATPSGSTTITAMAGDIVETGTGKIDTGRLEGGASGTGLPATPPAGDANFAISAGNTISTLTNFSVSGSFALEDDARLLIGTLTAGNSVAISGPAGSALPSGILVVDGTVTAGTSTAGAGITLSNGLGIAELASSVIAASGGVTLTSAEGAIAQQARASITGGENAASGTALALSSGGTTDFNTYLPARNLGVVSGLSLSGQLTAGINKGTTPYTGLAVLTATKGNIVENAGAVIRAGTLSGTASGTALFYVGAGNLIATITGLTAQGSIAIEDDSGLTLGNVSSGGTLSVAGPNRQSNAGFAGVLAIAGNVTAPGTITLANALGIAQLSGTLSSTGAGISLVTGGAIDQLADTSILTNEASGAGTALLLSAGGSTDFTRYLPNTPIGTVDGISFAGTLAAGTLAGGAYAGLADLTATSGNIVEGAGSLRAGTLTGAATAAGSGNVLLTPASGNLVATLGAFTAAGNFAFEDDSGLTVTGPLTAGNSIAIGSQQGANAGLPGGILVIAGTLTAAQDITLANALGVAERAGGKVTSTAADIVVTSAKGAIAQQQGGAFVAGGPSTAGTSLAFTAGGTTDFDTYLPNADIGTVSGISLAGLLTAGTLQQGSYTGLASFSALAGNVSEAASGTLQTGTLSGSAASSGGQPQAASGNASFDLSASNAVATVTGFTTTGNFVLAGGDLTLGTLTAGGTISIAGSVTGNQAAAGILVIDGSITATGTAAGTGSITLANATGIIETDTGTVTASSALSLVSGGAIVQLAEGDLAVTGTSLPGTVSLLAEGGTDFTPYPAFTQFGGVRGIALGGTLSTGATAGANGFVTGTASLVATAGDVTETVPAASAATGIINAGSLTAQAGAPDSPQFAIELDTGITARPGNLVGTFFGTDAAPFFSSGEITIADGGRVFGPTGGDTVTIEGAMIAAGGSLSVNIYGSDLAIADAGAVPISAAGNARFETIDGPAIATIGQIGTTTVTYAGSILQESGIIEAQNIALLAGYAVSQSAGATLLAHGGGENNPGAISILAKSGGDLAGGNVLQYGIYVGGTLEARNITLTALEGGIGEVAVGASVATGVIDAGATGTLTMTASAGTITGFGNIGLLTSSSGSTGNLFGTLGTVSADGRLAVVDGLALTVAGDVRAGLDGTAPSLQIVAPRIDVSTGTLDLVTGNTLSLVADHFTFTAAGDVRTAGLLALDLLGATAGPTLSVGTLAGNTVSPASLQNISAGTLALGSLDGINVSPDTDVSAGWSIGAGGRVSALDIDASFDLQAGGAAPILGLFSNGSIAEASGAGVTVATLYGLAANGTVLLGGPNAITTIGTEAGGAPFGLSALQDGVASSAVALQVDNIVPLTIVAPVTANKGAVQISVTGTAGQPPGLFIGDGTADSSANVSGTDVDLSAIGNITQVAGTIRAIGAAGSTDGTIVLASTEGGVSLGGAILGADPDQEAGPNPGSALLLSAGNGDVAETASASIAVGTLAAAASGNILLAAAGNRFAVIGPLASAASNLSLPGLTAGGTTGITVNDTVSLLVADGALISAYGPGGLAGPGTGAITMSLAAGSLTLGASSGATIAAPGDISLIAPGDIIQNGGLAAAGTGIVADSTGGSISIGGTVSGGGSLAGGLFTPSASSFVLLDAGNGDITEAAAGAIYAGTLSAAASGNIALTGENQVSVVGSQSAVAGLAQAVTLTLAGLSAGGRTGIAFTDLASLAVGPDSGATPVIEARAPGAALTITDNGAAPSGGTILIGGSGASSLLARGTISLSATGDILQESGLISAATTAVLAAGGDITQAAGATLAAGTLSAEAGGGIQLVGANAISDIAATGTFAGVTALTGSVAFNDDAPLTVLPGAAIEASTAGATIGITGTSIFVDGGTVTAAGDVAVSASAGLGQSAGLIQSLGGNVSLNGQSVVEAATAIIEAAQTVSIDSATGLKLDGTVQGGGVALTAGSLGISAGTGTLVAGTLAAQSAGAIDVSGPANLIAEIGDVGTLSGLSANGTITVGDSQSLSVAADVTGTSTIGFLVSPGDFTEAAGIAISTGGPLSIDAPAGAITLGGAYTGGALAILAGASVTELATGDISANGSATIKAGSFIELDGYLRIAGASHITATTNLAEGQTGTISIPAPATLSAPGSITLDGTVLVPGSLTVLAGASFTAGPFATITAGTTEIDAATGTASIGGLLTATGPLVITAGLDIDVAQTATVSGGGTNPYTDGGGVSLTSAGGAIDIEGAVTAFGTMSLAAATNITEGATAAINGGDTSITATAGAITIAGTLLTSPILAISAGTDVTLSSTGSIVGDLGVSERNPRTNPTVTTAVTAGGAITIAGLVLQADPMIFAAGTSFTEAATGVISGPFNTDPVTISAAGGTAAIGGLIDLFSGLQVTASGDIALTGTVSAYASASLSAGGAVTLADLSRLGAVGAVSLAAGSGITATGAISAGTTATLQAPGTITLGGTLSAPSILLGDAATADVVWNANTILTSSDLHGATGSIDLLNPLAGGPGVFIDAANFQQTGTSFVGPLSGKAATMQVTITGKGRAQFADLDAPGTQLLLVAKNAGFASGLIDVAGLNVYYTQTKTPTQAVDLYGTVGGRTGTSAAATGFAHLHSNINYQTNGCPIQSINCILLSPVIVPVIDPVNDYEEQTRRRRHLDDDALPNVGEEDY